jgi:tRNA(Ile)-lysidine synthase TilS/MesJ
MVSNRSQAFQSRIHITLGLPPLNQDNRLQIWYNFIRELKDVPKRDQKRFAHAAKTDWCKHNFNGRQIRNCVKAALVLGRRQNRMVDIQDFKDVIEVGVQFAQYVRKLRKMEAERLAESGGLRLDLSSSSNNPSRDSGRVGGSGTAGRSRRRDEFDSDNEDDDLSDF